MAEDAPSARGVGRTFQLLGSRRMNRDVMNWNNGEVEQKSILRRRDSDVVTKGRGAVCRGQRKTGGL